MSIVLSVVEEKECLRERHSFFYAVHMISRIHGRVLDLQVEI